MSIKTIVMVATFVIPMFASADGTTSGANPPTATARSSKLTEADVAVLAHQHHVDRTQIAMGKLAQRSGGSAVKSFGETLVRDHTTADKESMAFANKHGLAKIPTEIPTTEDEEIEARSARDTIAKLKKLTGAELDRELADAVATDHDKELAKLTAALPRIQDADLATMLRNKQPVMQRHADQAHELQMGNAAAATN